MRASRVRPCRRLWMIERSATMAPTPMATHRKKNRSRRQEARNSRKDMRMMKSMSVGGRQSAVGSHSRLSESSVPVRRKFSGLVVDLNDSPVAQRDRQIGDRGDLGIVGDEDERRLAGAVNLQEQVDDMSARRAVEVAGRLVGQQDRRVVRERARDGDALLLAARELRRIVMAAVRSGRLPRAAPLPVPRVGARRRSRSGRARSRTPSATAAGGRTGRRSRSACRAAAPARPR